MTDRRTAWIGTIALLAVAVAAPAVAHEEAKTKIDPSVILDLTAPRAPQPGRAYDESIRQGGPPPANPKTEWKQQSDGSYRYGNTTIIIRQDCPPGSEHFEPPPLPGRRR
jgi:hypothetical protein